MYAGPKLHVAVGRRRLAVPAAVARLLRRRRRRGRVTPRDGVVPRPRHRHVDRDVVQLRAGRGDVGRLWHVHRHRLHHGHRAGHVLGLKPRLPLREHGRFHLKRSRAAGLKYAELGPTSLDGRARNLYLMLERIPTIDNEMKIKSEEVETELKGFTNKQHGYIYS